MNDTSSEMNEITIVHGPVNCQKPQDEAASATSAAEALTLFRGVFLLHGDGYSWFAKG